MPTRKLTAKFIESVSQPPRGRIEFFDTLLPTFGLRVTERGVKSWVVMYRVHGRQRRLTLGRYPALSLADARERAQESLRVAATGIDPYEIQKNEKLLFENARLETVEAVSSLFIERYARPKNRSWRETKRIFDRHVISAWKGRQVGEVSRRDVIRLLDEIVDAGAPYMANRVLANLRRFFNWCIERDLIDQSPASHVKPPTSEQSRDRVLDDNEIARVWAAWADLGWPFGSALKIMLLTGQRRTEVAHMRWNEVDLASSSWLMPRSATKSDREHVVPLAGATMELLSRAPRTGEFIFSGNLGKPIAGFSKIKRRVDELSGVADWRIHDLRRTAASGMAGLGHPPHIVEKVLNHASGTVSGIAAVYNRHDYLREKREALDDWSEHVREIVSNG